MNSDDAIVEAVDREEAAKASGFDSWDDAAYWSNLAKQNAVAELAKAFARHRVAAIAAARPMILEEAAKVAEPHLAQCECCRDTSIAIAHAIRALQGGRR